MSKGQARNMQRISLKVMAGVAPDLPKAKQVPTIRQLQSMEIGRLARIRYAFEIEQRIEAALAAGESVGLLREKLAGVRNGTVPVPPGYGDRPTGPSLAASDMHIRRGKTREEARRRVREEMEERRSRQPKRPSRIRPLYRSEREAAADLTDLAKGKLTMTGVATVRGLLDRFDQAFVEATLSCPPGFIEKVKSSAAYGLAPKISAEDGLLLVGVLEERAPRPAAITEQPASNEPEDLPEP